MDEAVPKLSGVHLLADAVVNRQLHLKNIAAVFLQQPGEELDKLLPHALEKIGEQILLIGEVLVKAPTGNSGVPDNLVDGGVAEFHPGEFPPGRFQEAASLLLRQPEERLRTHMRPPLQK